MDKYWEAYYAMLRRRALRKAAEEFSPRAVAKYTTVGPEALWLWRKQGSTLWSRRSPVRVVRLVGVWLDEHQRLREQATQWGNKAMARSHGLENKHWQWAQARLRQVQEAIHDQS